MVDDNSPDGTGAIVDRLAQTLPVRCLHRPGKMGLSSGVIDGWSVARKESVAFGAMDADFSHDVNALPKMVEALASGRYGLAVGSRYVAGGGIAELAAPPHRHVAGRVLARAAAYESQGRHQRLFFGASRRARGRRASIRSDSRSDSR